ncbi:uncharacterized protein LOC133188093 [Saccostrea echinata]|uniref:uncharacterized protein LOC133188093 n=1 Tax=Saccostrea echinata TaxID=191078 RepID=UPI002A83D8B9|nr:uncharacterized protein LOC133188093 [Saccostrea echinata]
MLPIHVKETIDSLHLLVENYQRNQLNDTEYQKCGELFLEVDDRTNLARRMRAAAANELTPESFLEQTGIPLIYDLIQEIEDAFCTGSAVLPSFGILDPHNLPDTVQELLDYNQESINRLVEFYGTAKDDTFLGHRVQVRAQFDPVALRTELENFKRHLFILRRRGCTTIQSVYREFCQDDVLRDCFPLIYHLYYLALIIPSSTAVVERGFSLLSNIITKKRNRLTEQNTDALMRICHRNKELCDENLEKLVDNFKGLRKRKLQM